jgi:CRISPR-associated protein Csb2
VNSPWPEKAVKQRTSPVPAFEIEFLTNVVVASRDDAPDELDWPPQPDRVFSALVASWGARGRCDDEKAALEWLEQQEPPKIIAPAISQRTAPVVYVPPNDFKTSTASLDILPAARRRQARRFPAGYLEEPIVRHVWPNSTPPRHVAAALDALARDTSYIGHSISLTRCRFIADNTDTTGGKPARRCVYPGRLAELERSFAAHRRPNPGETTGENMTPEIPLPSTTVFSEQLIVLTDAGGSVPDLRAAAVIARKLRDTLMSAFPDPVPEWLSGHGPADQPSQRPHTAFIPLADVGWRHSQGRLMGFAIVPPRALGAPDVLALRSALVQQLEMRDGEPVLELYYDDKSTWYLSPSDVSSAKSLQADRWIVPFPSARPVAGATTWATATPIVLDRYPKGRTADKDEEIASIVRRACMNIGLPEPTAVTTSAISAVSGTPPAVGARNYPEWQRWRLPRALEGRMLVHAVLAFDEIIRGPVIVGAGRFAGLGLCLPRPVDQR